MKINRILHPGIQRPLWSSFSAFVFSHELLIFTIIHSDSARLICFEIRLISKEISLAEHEYMNIHHPFPVPSLCNLFLFLTGNMLRSRCQWLDLC